jgi:CBS-domain-containing membrane protein
VLAPVPVVPSTAAAALALAAILENPNQGCVYVLDAEARLAGVLPVATLLALSESEPILEHLEPPPPVVTAGADQENVALTALRYGLSAVPVTNDSGQFLGVVPASALLRVMHHEHVEDLDRLSGVLRPGCVGGQALRGFAGATSGGGVLHSGHRLPCRRHRHADGGRGGAQPSSGRRRCAPSWASCAAVFAYFVAIRSLLPG